MRRSGKKLGREAGKEVGDLRYVGLPAELVGKVGRAKEKPFESMGERMEKRSALAIPSNASAD